MIYLLIIILADIRWIDRLIAIWYEFGQTRPQVTFTFLEIGSEWLVRSRLHIASAAAVASDEKRLKPIVKQFHWSFVIIYRARLSVSKADRAENVRAIIIPMHWLCTAKRVLECLWCDRAVIVGWKIGRTQTGILMCNWVQYFCAMCARMLHLSV